MDVRHRGHPYFSERKGSIGKSVENIFGDEIAVGKRDTVWDW